MNRKMKEYEELKKEFENITKKIDQNVDSYSI